MAEIISRIIQIIVNVFIPRLHSGQKLVVKGFKRFNVIANGRRWGKTMLAVRLSMKTMLAGKKVGYFAPDPALFEDFWEELKTRLASVTVYKSEGKKIIRLNNGGEIKLWSLKKKNAGRSKKYHRVIIDEAAFADDLEYQWDKCIRPTLTDFEGDAFFFSSPQFGTFFHKIFDYFNKYDDWASFQMPTSTNPYITTRELKRIEQTTDPLTWAQEYLAKFVNLSGRAFAYCFERKKIVKNCGPLKKDLPVYLSFDFNVDPITCIAAQHPKDHSYIYIRHEFRLANSDIYKLCEEIDTKLRGYYFYVTGDASGKNRNAMNKDAMNYYTVIKGELNLEWVQFKVPKANPLIKNSRILVNSLLYRHPRFHIHPDCKFLIDDLELVQVKENGDIDKRNGQLTHLLDAFRYYLNTYFRSFIKLKTKSKRGT